MLKEKVQKINPRHTPEDCQCVIGKTSEHMPQGKL
jgi:hypothetical protein